MFWGFGNVTKLPDEMDACNALSLAVLLNSGICKHFPLDHLEVTFGINQISSRGQPLLIIDAKLLVTWI